MSIYSGRNLLTSDGDGGASPIHFEIFLSVHFWHSVGMPQVRPLLPTYIFVRLCNQYRVRTNTHKSASYFLFSSAQNVIRWTYSVFGGSLRSTNFMSFLRRKQRSCIRDCSNASPTGKPSVSGRVITVLKTSNCSIPPVSRKNLTREWISRTLLTLKSHCQDI